MNSLAPSKIAYLAIALTLGVANIHAAETIKEQVAHVVSDKVIDDDLYIFAEQATIDGTVRGDLIVFGREVVVNGTIEGDLVSAAQVVEINGHVGDDARVAGQTLRLGPSADISDDLVAAGYSLACASESHVRGELNYAGFAANLAGTVNKKVKLAGNRCSLSGTFGDDLKIIVSSRGSSASESEPRWGSELPPGLVVGDSASIAGRLDYRAVSEAVIAPTAKVAGDVSFTQLEDDYFGDNPSTASRLLAVAQRALAMLLVGGLLVYFCPSWTQSITERIQNQTVQSLGWGVFGFVSVLIVGLLTGIATLLVVMLLGVVRLENLIPATLGVGGLSLAVTAVFFTVFAVWVASTLVATWTGNRLTGVGDGKPGRVFVSLLLGVAIVAALTGLPYIGGFIAWIVSVLGVGATALWLKEAVRHSRISKQQSTTQAENQQAEPIHQLA